ncbi:hypothetical protein COJ21_26550 [Priestia megaterium]|uniref:hypothetical protein n=1 Tax=Priestia megaterium TaxID=1404 RepID=UPI000BF8A73C|nr:hypothetical protein [Priestia megaterium]PFK63486.1 hypothetical protein COJ21_26550 [Priestia megaterium]
MKTVKLIEDKLDNLVKLMLTAGVQPSELADNVFVSEYKSISFAKRDNSIIGELIFEEVIGEISIDVLLRYYYDTSKRVVLIEEEINNKVKVLWDRDTKEIELINEIVNLLKELDTKKVSEFISSLPSELSDKVQHQYKKAV